MKCDYSDITSHFNESPDWYDQNGVPRYETFKPDMCPDIYANTVMLFRIECQACGQKFLVEMHWGYFDNRASFLPREMHYGDPPRHDTCVGDTMNCEDLDVLEVWHREIDGEWKRMKDLEGPITPRSNDEV